MPVELCHLTKILLESTCTEDSIAKCKHEETEVILLIKEHHSCVLVDTGQFLLLSIYHLSSVLNTHLGNEKIIIKFLLKTATALNKSLHDLFLTFSEVQAFFSIGEINIGFNLNMLQMSKMFAFTLSAQAVHT